jgi:MFS family permease
VGALAKGFSMNVLMVTAQASLGDLYKNAPALYGRFVSLFMMMPPLSGVISPIVGSALAARSLRLPYAVGACLSLASIAVTGGLLQESCGASSRKPFVWMRSNPLNFLRLFTNGVRLRCAAHTHTLVASSFISPFKSKMSSDASGSWHSSTRSGR